MDTESISLSIVIPLYCEGSHVNKLVNEIRKYLKDLFELWELVLVDDGSTDDTWTQIEKQTQNVPLLQGIKLSRNFGKEAALCAGLEIARGEIIVVLDGDLQHPPELIPDMVRIRKETGVNIVEAVKKSRGEESIINRIFSRLFYGLFTRLSGFNLRKASDYKLFDRQVRDAWLKMGEKNLFFRGMIAWLGFKREQISFAVKERKQGKSGWSTIGLIKLALVGLTAFSGALLHVPTLLGIIFFVFALFLGFYSLCMKFSGSAVSGFTTVILLQLVIGSLFLVSLGIMGEYLARIYEETKGRPRYIVDKIIESKGH